MRKRGMRPIPACIVAIILPLTGLSFGQARIERGSKLAQKIEHSSKIMIVTPEGEETGCRAVIREEGIAVSREGMPRAVGYDQSTLIPWEDIWAIKVRKTGARLGAWIGVGGGAALGLALTAYFSRLEDMSPAPAAWLIKGAFIGGAAGALGGILIGSLFTHWKILYSTHAGGRPLPTIILAPMSRGGISLSVGLSF